MLTPAHMKAYHGPALERGDSFIYLAPHPLLRPYIPCYTLTCPVQSGMAEDYTILPTASTTLIFSIGENHIDANLRGVNTVASVVGGHARNYGMLLLIEFHPGALRPFIRHPLEEFANVSMEYIRSSRGVLSGSQLSREVHYSERHLRRLFHENLGTGVKTYSRIVRVNHAIALLCRRRISLEAAAGLTGYHDLSHLIRDFRDCCGITPQEYLDRMSVFYSDTYKL